MTDTPNLGLPCIEGSQAQKHVTHNDALRMLDTLVQLAVLTRTLTAPPASPSDGQRWIVKATGTGAWAGHDNAIAAWQDGAWIFSTPQIGWLAYVVDESALLAWDGGAWTSAIDALTPTALNDLTLLGLGTTADTTNPFSAKLNNALWTAESVAEGGDGDLRYKLSKEAAANTLSFLFQDAYSGRAEIGLTGDDDFHFKVSADGTTWYEGIVIDRTTGAVTFPHTTISGGREILSADRTYYVRTDGSDANDGLTDSTSGAFLTVQKALDVAFGTIDLGGHNITIQVGNGSFAGATVLGPQVGSGVITLQGDVTTPSNVTLTSTIDIENFAVLAITGFKRVGGSFGLRAVAGGVILVKGLMEYGATTFDHVVASQKGQVIVNYGTNATISGGGRTHYWADTGGLIVDRSGTKTVTGTPAFSGFFAVCQDAGSQVYVDGITWSGSATGTRYYVSNGGVISTSAGTSYLPGDAAGSGTNFGASPWGLYA